MTRHILLRTAIAPLAASAVLLLGCGGESDTDDPQAAAPPTQETASVAGTREALLAYARCMREQGVDMPDPRTDETGRLLLVPPEGDTGTPRFQAADRACSELRDSGVPAAPPPEAGAELRAAMLEHARCMREQGIDMPDPQVAANGGATIPLGGAVDPSDPDFREAQERCRDKLPLPPAP